MKKHYVIILMLCIFFVAAGSLYAQLPRLGVKGNTIVRLDTGEPVILHGLNWANNYWDQYYDDKLGWDIYTQPGDFELAASWGCNLIRFNFGADFFYPVRGNDPKGAWAYFDESIRKAGENGMYVILDMHQAPGSETIDPLKNDFWYKPAEKKRLIELMKTMAARYKDNPVVMGYDLYNEPVAPTDDEYWDYIDTLVTTIRSVDDKAILIVEPNNFKDFRKLDDPNVMYSFHVYEPFVVTHAGQSWITGTPLMSGYMYPGEVPVNVNAGGYDLFTRYFEKNIRGWESVTDEYEVPDDTELAFLNFFAAGGKVKYAGLKSIKVFVNDKPVILPHLKITRSAEWSPETPTCWQFNSDEDYVGSWEKGIVSISGTGEYGAWYSTEWWLYEDYIPVKPGDTIRFEYSVMVKGLAKGAAVGMQPMWGKRNMVYFDKEKVKESYADYVAWGKKHNVPLFMGEYGSAGYDPQSRANYIKDTVAICREYGMPSTYWIFRGVDNDPDKATSFGIIEGNWEAPEQEHITDEQAVKACIEAWKHNTSFK